MSYERRAITARLTDDTPSRSLSDADFAIRSLKKLSNARSVVFFCSVSVAANAAPIATRQSSNLKSLDGAAAGTLGAAGGISAEGCVTGGFVSPIMRYC